MAAGNYQLTITDDNACKTVQEFTIDLSTSTQYLVEKGSFRLFPNPSPGPVQLDWAGLEQPQSLLQLFDLSGKLILEERLQHADRLQINRDWSDLPEGQYLLRLQNGTKQISRPWIKIKG
ncbi:MAG: T9SS type A sorting domain-containing protein [Bacteroidota bacterium]